MSSTLLRRVWAFFESVRKPQESVWRDSWWQRPNVAPSDAANVPLEMCRICTENCTITLCFGADNSWLGLQQTRQELSGAQRLNARRLCVDMEQ